jgi:WW domain-containing oxidoreductase
MRTHCGGCSEIRTSSPNLRVLGFPGGRHHRFRRLKGAFYANQYFLFSAAPIVCDLTELESVEAAADSILRLPGPLDAIITNAGIANLPTLQTRYGIELQFLVNHIAHFALVNRLADSVRSGTGRIVIVSSDASIEQAPAEGVLFDNLDGQRFYEPFTFYGQAKLAAALFAKELSRRLSSRGVAVNSLHPGSTRGTGFGKYQNLTRLRHRVARLFMKSPAQGAATQTLLAASPQVACITGEYWADCQIAPGQSAPGGCESHQAPVGDF